MAGHAKSARARAEAEKKPLTTAEIEQAFLKGLEEKPDVVNKGLRELSAMMRPTLRK